MFPPDADVSPYHPSATLADASGDPKTIKYGNTRLPEQDDRSSSSHALSAPPSPTRSRVDAAIAGTPCTHLPASYATHCLTSYRS
jgi:protein DGCR14